jgi:hypothetical protein
MGITKQFREFATSRVTRKLTRALPWVGAVIALATLGGAIRRKGLWRGTVHTALDLTPYVGSLKNLAEASRGRDFIRDRPRPEAPRLT